MTRLTSACSARLMSAGLALVAFAVAAPSVASQFQTNYSWSSGDAFVLMKNGGDNTIMSGSTDDLRIVERLRNGTEPLLYFRRGGKSYLVRDAAVLRQAEAIFKPQQELGARQGELGSRQGALGKKQAELGRQQAAAALRHVSGDHAEAARQQAALATQQSELGRHQSALGRQQSELGRQQSELARQANAKLGALMDDVLRRGLAQEVR